MATLTDEKAIAGVGGVNRLPLMLLALLLIAARAVSWKILISAAAVAAIIAWAMKPDRRHPRQPPSVSGLPVLGCGLQFRRNAVPFLLSCRRKFGDIFTLPFPLGQRIHFVMNPHHVNAFSSQPGFDFDPIQRAVNWNVFGFKIDGQQKMLRHMSKHVRRAVDTDAFSFAEHANESLGRLADDNGWNCVKIDEFVNDTMFRSIFSTVYGDAEVADGFNYQTAKSLMTPIHQTFLFMWLGLPRWLFPSTSHAWKTLYARFPSPHCLLQNRKCNAYITESIGKWLNDKWSVKNIVGHNMVYLHVYHNNCKITFWLINNLAYHAEQAAQLLMEIEEALERDEEGEEGDLRIELNRLESLPLLDSFIQETYRLASGLFLMRHVTKDVDFDVGDGESVFLREGDLVTMYPPAYHKDPEIYTNPEEFRLDRFANGPTPSFRGVELKRPVLPYGLLCPGQRLSMVQLKFFVVTLLVNFCVEGDGDNGGEYNYSSYGDEILPPLAATGFRYRLRDSRFRPVRLSRCD